MKKIGLCVLIASLLGCASIEKLAPSNEQALKAYKVCAAADIGSTALFLHTSNMVELNPIMKAAAIHGIGHTAGFIVPAIGFAIAGYYVLKWLDKPIVTTAVAVTQCSLSAHNLYLLRLEP